MITLSRPDTEADSADLRAWIREHRVCWETVLHRESCHGNVRSIGYDVILTARLTGSGPSDPADERSVDTFQRLAQLARRILPASTSDSASLEGFEPAFHLRPEAHWTPEVRVVIEVRHDDTDYFAPPDGGERDSLRELESALAQWGVQRESWR